MDTKIFVHFVCCFGKRPHGRSPGFQYFQRTLSLVTNTPVSPGTSAFILSLSPVRKNHPPKRERKGNMFRLYFPNLF